MKTGTTTNEERERQGLSCSDLLSSWNVWRVAGYFFAAESLQQAKETCLHEGWVDEVEDWDDAHSDHAGYFREATEWDEIWDESPDCTMRERAEEMINEGESIPFMVGCEIG